MNRIRFAHHRHWTMRRNLWAVVVHRRRRHWLESDHDDSLDLCLFHKILSTFLSYMISRFTFFVCVMVIWGIYAFSLYKFFQWEISLVLIFTPFPWVPPWSGVKKEFLLRHRRKNHSSCSKAQNLDNYCCDYHDLCLITIIIKMWWWIKIIVDMTTCSRRAPHPGEDEKAAAQDWRRHRT